MVKIEETARYQAATLWAKSGDDRYGEPTVTAPVNITVRWVEKRGQVMGKDDTPIRIDGRVVVNLDIEEGSIVRLGLIADLPDPVTGGLMEIVGFDKTADLKARNNRRVCLIRKYKDTLPTIVP